MRAHLKGEKQTPDIVLDFASSQFSADEIIKQIALRLHDHPFIHTLVIENAEIYEKGALALRQAILGHKSLRTLALLNLKICSYYVSVPEELSDEYFPKDLDLAVEHLAAILRDGRLQTVEVTRLQFVDRSERHFEHFDMVEPALMRDLVLQEKGPFYVKEITDSLNHNPHLCRINLSIDDVDVHDIIEEIEKNIRRRHAAEEINNVLRGTHASLETENMHDFLKLFAWRWWLQQWMKKNRR